jgi:hypothetical protein
MPAVVVAKRLNWKQHTPPFEQLSGPSQETAIFVTNVSHKDVQDALVIMPRLFV